MAYHLTTQHGATESEPSADRMHQVLTSIDPNDAEHPDVSLTHESAWCLGVFASGLVVFENLEEGEPRHMRLSNPSPPKPLIPARLESNFLSVHRWRAWHFRRRRGASHEGAQHRTDHLIHNPSSQRTEMTKTETTDRTESRRPSPLRIVLRIITGILTAVAFIAGFINGLDVPSDMPQLVTAVILGVVYALWPGAFFLALYVNRGV